jgi:hypothetical protein
MLSTARPPARPVLGLRRRGPNRLVRWPSDARWWCAPPAHPPAARRRRSPWLPWTASVSGLLVSSAPYQVTSASRGHVHDLIVDSAASAHKPQASVQRRERHPLVQRARGGGSSCSVRAWSVLGPWRSGITGARMVTSGETEPQVGRPPGQAPRATPAARSDCGLGGHPLWQPSTPAGITCEVLRFGRPVRRVRAGGCRWYRPAGGLGRTGREHQGRTLVSGLRRWWAPAWDGLGRSRTGHG